MCTRCAQTIEVISEWFRELQIKRKSYYDFIKSWQLTKLSGIISLMSCYVQKSLEIKVVGNQILIHKKVYKISDVHTIPNIHGQTFENNGFRNVLLTP